MPGKAATPPAAGAKAKRVTASADGVKKGPKAAPAATEKRQRTMSVAHKAALAAGREEGRAVRRYLEALDSHRPKRGRKRTTEGMLRRLAAVEGRLAMADPLARLHLVQERMDLQRQIEAGGDSFDMAPIEAEFTGVAAAYGERKGISYEAWRALGIEPRVLAAAGIRRG